MLDRAQSSADAIKAYAAWLKALKNEHPRSFRLGKEFYEEKFKYELQSQYTSQQIFQCGYGSEKDRTPCNGEDQPGTLAQIFWH